MKDDILQQLSIIPDDDTANLITLTRSLTQQITSYFILGIDPAYYNELSEFRLLSQALLNAYDTHETHQADDNYWLLYWAIYDDSLQTTYNGYNYLHLLLSPAVQKHLDQRCVKKYISSIIKLIKAENMCFSNII